jgi:hypothetical protein
VSAVADSRGGLLLALAAPLPTIGLDTTEQGRLAGQNLPAVVVGRGRCPGWLWTVLSRCAKAAPSCCSARLGGLPGVIDGAHAGILLAPTGFWITRSSAWSPIEAGAKRYG